MFDTVGNVPPGYGVTKPRPPVRTIVRFCAIAEAESGALAGFIVALPPATSRVNGVPLRVSTSRSRAIRWKRPDGAEVSDPDDDKLRSPVRCGLDVTHHRDAHEVGLSIVESKEIVRIWCSLARLDNSIRADHFEPGGCDRSGRIDKISGHIDQHVRGGLGEQHHVPVAVERDDRRIRDVLVLRRVHVRRRSDPSRTPCRSGQRR
jgi:hypothetical protein